MDTWIFLPVVLILASALVALSQTLINNIFGTIDKLSGWGLIGEAILYWSLVYFTYSITSFIGLNWFSTFFVFVAVIGITFVFYLMALQVFPIEDDLFEKDEMSMRHEFC